MTVMPFSRKPDKKTPNPLKHRGTEDTEGFGENCVSPLINTDQKKHLTHGGADRLCPKKQIPPRMNTDDTDLQIQNGPI
jgi:hypothetical protein